MPLAVALVGTPVVALVETEVVPLERLPLRLVSGYNSVGVFGLWGPLSQARPVEGDVSVATAGTPPD